MVFIVWSLFFLVTTFTFGQSKECQRIITIAPSITEIIYNFSLDKHLIGVSSLDTFPNDVANKERIGGFLDPNIEKIVALHPSIVIGLKEQEDLLVKLELLNIKTITVEHRNVTGILNSITSIASVCGINNKGIEQAKILSDELQAPKERLSHLTKKKVLLVVSRDYQASTLKELYISGTDGYYDTLLNFAGGENVLKEATRNLGSISYEGLLALNPDVIIEVFPEHYFQQQSIEVLKKPWSDLSQLKAIKSGNLFLTDESWATIPGPRMNLLFQYFLKILHPEVLAQ